MSEVDRLQGVMEGVQDSLKRIETKVDKHAEVLGRLAGKQAKVEGGLLMAKWLGGSAVFAVAAQGLVRWLGK